MPASCPRTAYAFHVGLKTTEHYSQSGPPIPTAHSAIENDGSEDKDGEGWRGGLWCNDSRV